MRSGDGGDTMILTTGGTCMLPFIWPGGQLYIERCAPAELRVGDIAVWFDGKRLFSHRVIALAGNNAFVTRGDLCAHADPLARSEQLVGRAVAFGRRGLRYRLDGQLARACGRALATAFLRAHAAGLRRPAWWPGR